MQCMLSTYILNEQIKLVSERKRNPKFNDFPSKTFLLFQRLIGHLSPHISKISSHNEAFYPAACYWIRNSHWDTDVWEARCSFFSPQWVYNTSSSSLCWFVFSIWKARWTQWGLGLLLSYFCWKGELDLNSSILWHRQCSACYLQYGERDPKAMWSHHREVSAFHFRADLEIHQHCNRVSLWRFTDLGGESVFHNIDIGTSINLETWFPQERESLLQLSVVFQLFLCLRFFLTG